MLLYGMKFSSIYSDYSFYDSRQSQENLGGSIFNILRSHELLRVLVARDLVNKYKRSVLGILWSMFTPLLATAVIYFVFNGIFAGRMPEQRGYASYVYSGIILQTFIVSGIPLASNALAAHTSYIKKLRVAPYIFGISSSISQAFQFLISCFPIIPLAFISNQALSWRVILLPGLALLCILTLSGFGMLMSGVMIRYDDSGYIVSTILMIMGYLTPIFYTISSLPANVAFWVNLNPLTSYVLIARWMMFPNYDLNLANVVYASVLSLAVFLLGLRKIGKNWNKWMMYL